MNSTGENTRQLRICHVITRMIVGGAQENTLLTIRGHREAGMECELVTGPSPGREGELLKQSVNEGLKVTVFPELVRELYRVEVPAEGDSRTTYNVGVINGGTSVNTIAQSAELLYEYRSDDPRCLAEMEGIFQAVLAKCSPEAGTLSAERIGERPCAGQVDEGAMDDLIGRAAAAVREATGREPVFTSGSTDCNIPLAAGIPAVCLGVCAGGGCHTREEWLDPASLADGCRLFLEFFGHYLEN